jgi:hypothetical protein
MSLERVVDEGVFSPVVSDDRVSCVSRADAQCVSLDFKRWQRRILSLDANQGAAAMREPLPRGVAEANVSQFEDAGFRFSDESPRYGSTYPHNHIERVEFSFDYTHRALTLSHAAWPGALLWIDAEAIDLPTNECGQPLADSVGRWIDNDVYVIAVGGVARSLLIYDAARQKRLLVTPYEGENWSAPFAVRSGTNILCYADAESRLHGRIARTIAW